MNNEKCIEQPLLSICIPTWNRAKFLKISLDRIKEQIKYIDSSLLELYVSDNCSSDETEMVVKEYITEGMPINYNRNQENLGMDGNFLKCIQNATGKYIMLVGDDDAFKNGAISYLLNTLLQDDWGMLHIACIRGNDELETYNAPNTFFKRMSYYTTYISANIFRSDIVKQVNSPERYFKSFFLHIPYYIKAINAHPKNIVINKDIFDGGLDSGSNGGYNFYEVFVVSFLGIIKEYVKTGELLVSTYSDIKKDLYQNFILKFNYMLLVKHERVKDIDKSGNGRNGFAIDNAWKILFKHYGMCWYFYYSFFWMLGKRIKEMTKHCLRNIGLYK